MTFERVAELCFFWRTHTGAELDLLIFGDLITTREKIEKILAVPHLLLVASHGGRSVGFKVGYADPDRLKHFHSWLGGVLPAYRRQGIAWKMLQQQEDWAQSQGFQTIGFNTFDRYPAMQAMGHKAGYQIARTSLEKGETMYWFEKSLID